MRRRLVLPIACLLTLAACAPAPTRPQAAAPVAAPEPAGPAAFEAASEAVTRAPAIAAGTALVAPVRPAGPRQSAAWQRASLKGRAIASSGPAEAAVDGDGESEWNPRAFVTPGAPQWLALPLAKAAKQPLALAWHGHALHYVNYDYGRPRTYEVQVSSDSTDGSGGSWKTVATVKDNLVRSRATTFDAPGATWVRLRFLTAWSGVDREPFLREASVYERDGVGAVDAWLVMGDSTTSVGMDPAKPPYLQRFVAAKHPGHMPIAMSGGTGGDTAESAIARLRVALPTLPPGSLVGLLYGSNDAKHGRAKQAYRKDLQAAIDAIRAAGHDPLLGVVPWSLNGDIAHYAQVCKDLATANNLPPGPDFYTWFKDHPDELEVDKVHPNEAGSASMQRLWAEAGAFRYAND